MQKQRFRDLINPKYEPNEWQKFKNAGCYPYALNIKINEFFLVGDLIDRRCDCYVSDNYLIQTLKEELRAIFDLKFKEIATDYKAKKGEMKIYLQRNAHTGYYHFLREDSDRLWSHKFPNELPIRVDTVGNLIEDPDSMVDTAFCGWCFLLKR